jgi:hypothetical protein
MAWNQDFGAGANPGSTYEQQSWRDSYNGGRAAGDWTGNHNARLDAERQAFQGATWSGSSTQPSALQFARSFVGSGVASFTSGTGNAGTGPGNSGVIKPAEVRKTSGGNLTFAGNGPGAYRPGFSPGLIDWRNPKQFSDAPEIDGIENKPLKRIGIGGAQEAPGAISDIGWARTAGGGYVVVPSSDVKERIEDDLFTQAQWSWRNIWGPSIGVVPQPQPDFLNPRNSHYDMSSGQWMEGVATEWWHRSPSIVGGGF